MDDDAPLEPGAGRPVPAGAPIRVIEWLTPPIGVALLAGLVVYASTGAGSRPASGEAIVLALLLVGAAAAVGVFGYRAYRDLTARAVEHHAEAGVVALLIVGLALSSGVFVIVPFGWAGYLAATLRRRPVARARAALPARVWRRTAIIAAPVGLLCVLLLPVADGLDSAPLVWAMAAGRIVAPFVFGFAFRLRRRPAAM